MEFKHLSSPPLFLADNLALDFINTEYGTGDERQDCFENDLCVVEWLETAGLVPTGTEAPAGLLAEARLLRDAARTVVHAAMASVAAEDAVEADGLARRGGVPEHGRHEPFETGRENRAVGDDAELVDDFRREVLGVLDVLVPDEVGVVAPNLGEVGRDRAELDVLGDLGHMAFPFFRV